ncbi:MAG: NAD(P)H-hydrate dehydratase [Oscillospiraceae bacterium]
MQVIDRAFVRGLMPARDQGGHKGTFGKVYLLGGSVGYTGAPVLCAGGAVHSGCGLVFLGVPETVWPIAAARCLCAMPHPLAEQDGRLSAAAETEIRRRAATCDAVAVGCGLGRSEGSDVLVRAADVGKAAGAGRRRHKRAGGAYRYIVLPPGLCDGADAPRRGTGPHRRRHDRAP